MLSEREYVGFIITVLLSLTGMFSLIYTLIRTRSQNTKSGNNNIQPAQKYTRSGSTSFKLQGPENPIVFKHTNCNASSSTMHIQFQDNPPMGEYTLSTQNIKGTNEKTYVNVVFPSFPTALPLNKQILTTNVAFFDIVIANSIPYVFYNSSADTLALATGSSLYGPPFTSATISSLGANINDIHAVRSGSITVVVVSRAATSPYVAWTEDHTNFTNSSGISATGVGLHLVSSENRVGYLLHDGSNILVYISTNNGKSFALSTTFTPLATTNGAITLGTFDFVSYVTDGALIQLFQYTDSWVDLGTLAGISSVQAVVHSWYQRVLIVVYQLASGLYFVTSSDLSNWSAPRQISTSTTNNMELFPDANNNLVLLTGENGTMYYYQWNGTQFNSGLYAGSATIGPKSTLRASVGTDSSKLYYHYFPSEANLQWSFDEFL